MRTSNGIDLVGLVGADGKAGPGRLAVEFCPPAVRDLMLARSFHNAPMMSHLLANAAKRPRLSARSYSTLTARRMVFSDTSGESSSPW